MEESNEPRTKQALQDGFINKTETICYQCGTKVNMDPYLTPYIKINFRWIKNL